LDKLDTEADEVHHDANNSTVALAKLVTEIGPDIAEISRRLGQFKESVRYRYKEKIVKRGFAIKADLDYGALGLHRVVMKLRVAAAHSQHVHEIFEAMSEICYVVAYAGTMPDQRYIVHAAVPAEFTNKFRHVMAKLEEKGIFSSVELSVCDWFRVAPMRAECFNFDEGVWDFDWSKPPPVDDDAARGTISEKKPVDKIDLLLLKELWRNGDRSLTEIHAAIRKANGIDINYKTLGWHYTNHVVGRHLIRDYSIAWHRFTYSLALDKVERTGKHSYLGVSLIVKATNAQDTMMLRSSLNRLPFLWSEAAGEAYYSQLFFPLDTVNEGLEYLTTLLKPYGERAEIFLLDQREMQSFTIAYKLWDEPNGRWTFDTASILARLERAAVEIGKRTYP
jgi:DNA-binding Lrp family transcriptional regulator